MSDKFTIFVVSNNGPNDDDDDENYEDEEWIVEEDDCDCEEEENKKSKKSKKSNKQKKSNKPNKPITKPKIKIKFLLNENVCDSIKTLQDLINILDHKDGCKEQKDLVEALKELNNMIGLATIKEQVINQILFFMQDLNEPGTFLHTVLTGDPGCGKTTCVHILAKIYKNLGFLETDNVVSVSRKDLIGQWLGHTAKMTHAALESAKGGVLLIDEAYSLGNSRDDDGDSFSKECIDTINQYLSEHVDELMCIIAGYKDKIDDCFFRKNPGLERRFPWRFNIDRQTPEELYEILLTQLGPNNSSWTLDVPKKDVVDMITKHYDKFKGNGGDTRNLLDKCKIQHARRVFIIKTPTIDNKIENTIDNTIDNKTKTKTKKEKETKKRKREPIVNEIKTIYTNRIITREDFQSGFKIFIKGKEINKPPPLSMSVRSMYM